jgi:SAM-dependent methyltransferase
MASPSPIQRLIARGGAGLPPRLRVVGRGALSFGESLLKRGDGVQCPCCAGRFRSFSGSGGNARCPRCWSLARHRTLYLYLRDNGLLRPSLRLLHIAPEEGIYRHLRGNEEYVPADLFPGTRSVAQFSVEKIPHPDDSFDVVLCSHVLEHVPDDAGAMREFRRILAPAGRAVLQHPIKLTLAHTFEDDAITSPEERERAYGQHDHLRLYGRDFGDRLRSVGFDVEVIRYSDELSYRDRRRFGLFDDGEINDGDLYVAR